METTPSKTCSKCEKTKKVTSFHKCASGKHGVHSICKPCRIVTETARGLAYREANPERFRKRQRESYRRRKEDGRL